MVVVACPRLSRRHRTVRAWWVGKPLLHKPPTASSTIQKARLDEETHNAKKKPGIDLFMPISDLPERQMRQFSKARIYQWDGVYTPETDHNHKYQ